MHAVVHLRDPGPPVPRLGYVRSESGVLPPGPPPRDPRKQALLLLEPKDAAAVAAPSSAAAAAAPVEIQLLGLRAVPAMALLPSGTPLLIRNDDRVAHTLRGSGAADAPPLRIPPGGSATLRLPATGEHTLTSDDYPHLTLTVVVPRGPAAPLAWSEFGEVGVARFEAPAGSYTARLLLLGRTAVTQEVVVATTGAEFILRASWPAPTPSPPSGEP